MVQVNRVCEIVNYLNAMHSST